MNNDIDTKITVIFQFFYATIARTSWTCAMNYRTAYRVNEGNRACV